MPGKYAAAPGATTCTECPKGKQSYDDTAVTSTQLAKICKDAGTMSPYKCGSSTGCYTCPMGKYAENTGELLCDTCKGNTYTDQMGQDNCPYCPPGKQAENWDPDLIKEGGNIDDFYSACEADDCQEPEGTASTKCDPCPRGRFSTDVNEFREDDSSAQKLGCKSCFLSTMYGPGFTSDPGMDSCFHCPAGTVGNSSGLCELCEAGKYQNSTGGEIGRGAKRRADNAITSGKNHTRLYFRTRRFSSVNSAIIPIPHRNPFCDLLRSHRKTLQRVQGLRRGSLEDD